VGEERRLERQTNQKKRPNSVSRLHLFVKKKRKRKPHNQAQEIKATKSGKKNTQAMDSGCLKVQTNQNPSTYSSAGWEKATGLRGGESRGREKKGGVSKRSLQKLPQGGKPTKERSQQSSTRHYHVAAYERRNRQKELE